MKVVSGIMRVLSWIVYLVILVALLSAAPILFGNRPEVILSGSMEPAYPVGSLIYYKQAEFNSIEAGDAITFEIGEGSYATHRVVSINEEEQSFITKGDNNPTEDTQPVSYDRVKGKVRSICIPYAGYFAKFIQNWWAIAAMGMILLLDMVFGVKENKSGAADKEDNKECSAESIPKRRKEKVTVSAEDFFKDL